MATKTFSLRTILTVTTGRLLTKSKGDRDNGISDLYELLGWMTNDSPYTHQLGRFAEECKPWLLRWFPDLARAEAALPELDNLIGLVGAEKGVELWLQTLIAGGQRAEFSVPKIPADDHEAKNPVEELIAMRGPNPATN